MSVTITKRKLIWALSGAIDLVGITDVSHGKRVAHIASCISKELNNFPWSQDDVITSSLLHDCGVSSTDVHEHLINEMEWDKAHEHCIRGEKLLLSQPEFSHLATSVGLHHTRWSNTLVDNDKLLGNLIFLADRIDVLAATGATDILIEKNHIIKKITHLSGKLFSPEFVNAFLEVAKKDIFWLNWCECYSGKPFLEWLNENEAEVISYSSLKRIFTLFGSCVDGKSPFTYNHSVGVAALSRKIGELYGITGKLLDELELAGLMHDIGKLKVPDFILDKPDKLCDDEFNIMRHHSYDTSTILSPVEGLGHIVTWASQHHEKLNGTGYPKGDTLDQISTESRILIIADIFQALAQDRPYRKGMSLTEILSILTKMASDDELDRDLVEVVLTNSEVCLKSALINIVI